MPDVQWSNESLPPPKPGLSTPVKAAIGCGLLMLVTGGACVAVVLTGASKVTHAVTSMGEAEWPVIKQVTDQIATEPGAEAVWAAHPKLNLTFTDRDDFLREMAALRPYLEPMPEARPGVMSGKLGMSFNYKNDDKEVIARYQTRLGPQLIYTFENGELVNLQLERPTRTVPMDLGSTGSDPDPAPASP